MMTAFFLILAGLAYGLKEHVSKRHWLWEENLPNDPHWYGRVVVPPIYAEWWNQKRSWMNKYQYRDRNRGPAFPTARWIGVVITDAEHFFQSVAFFCIGLAVWHHDLIFMVPSDLPAWSSSALRLVMAYPATATALASSAIFSTGFSLSWNTFTIILDPQLALNQQRMFITRLIGRLIEAWQRIQNRVAVMHSKRGPTIAFYATILAALLFYIVGIAESVRAWTGSERAAEFTAIFWVLAIVGSYAYWYFVSKRRR